MSASQSGIFFAYRVIYTKLMANKFVWFILVLSPVFFLPAPVKAADQCVEVKDSAGNPLKDKALLSPWSTIYIDGQAVKLPSNPQAVVVNSALPEQLPAEPVTPSSKGAGAQQPGDFGKSSPKTFFVKFKKLAVGSWEIVMKNGTKQPEIMNQAQTSNGKGNCMVGQFRVDDPREVTITSKSDLQTDHNQFLARVRSIPELIKVIVRYDIPDSELKEYKITLGNEVLDIPDRADFIDDLDFAIQVQPSDKEYSSAEAVRIIEQELDKEIKKAEQDVQFTQTRIDKHDGEDLKELEVLKKSLLHKQSYLARLIADRKNTLAFRASRVVTPIATHVTSVKGMAASLLFGEILPGNEAIKIFNVLEPYYLPNSVGQANFVAFSVGNVINSYGIKKYPEDVLRTGHSLGSSTAEVFFAIKSKEVTKLDNNSFNRNSLNFSLSLDIEKAREMNLPIADYFEANQERMKKAYQEKSLKGKDFYLLMDLLRQVNKFPNNESFDEIRSKTAIPVDKSIVAIPKDFRPAIERALNNTVQMINDFLNNDYQVRISELNTSIQELELSAESDVDRREYYLEQSRTLAHEKNELEAIYEKLSHLDLSDENIVSILDSQNIWYYSPEEMSAKGAIAKLSTDLSLQQGLNPKWLEIEEETNEVQAAPSVSQICSSSSNTSANLGSDLFQAPLEPVKQNNLTDQLRLIHTQLSALWQQSFGPVAVPEAYPLTPQACQVSLTQSSAEPKVLEQQTIEVLRQGKTVQLDGVRLEPQMDGTVRMVSQMQCD